MFKGKYFFTIFLFIIFEAEASNIKNAPVTVKLMNDGKVSVSEQRKWKKVCQNFAKKLEIGRGYWKSGVASKSRCDFIRLPSSRSKGQIKGRLNQKNQGFNVFVEVIGEEPKLYQEDNPSQDQKTETNSSQISKDGDVGNKEKIEKNSSPEKKIESGSTKTENNLKANSDSDVGEPVKFMDELYNQIFEKKIVDNRTINFKLVYIYGKNQILLADRTYPYNSKFFEFMDLEGFSDLLAFDILVHSPMQWHKSVITENEFVNPLTLTKEKKLSFEITNPIHDIELNKNLFFVRPKIDKDKIFVAESTPLPVSKKSKIEVTKSGLLSKFIVFDELTRVPQQSDAYLSLGHDPITRYYTSKEILYLIRKLERINLNFFFAEGDFGVSQLLSTNDELSYLGLRYARGLSQEKKILANYFNIDLSINSGMVEGLTASFNLWPKTTESVNNVSTDLQCYNLLFSYKYSLLLPVRGVIHFSPSIGFWGFEASSRGEFSSSSFSEPASLTFGLGAGYSLNILDLIISGYSRYSSSVASESQISMLELGADVGYQLIDIPSMQTLYPAVYGFVLLQQLDVTNVERESQITSNGLVVGIGGSVVWE